MDIRWLQDFLTVADTQNFTRAAQLRHVSQAAFSRRIKALESWLGKALIDRTSFPTCLTPDGELFRERASEIVQQIADARLTGTAIGRRKQIRLALPHSLATGRLPNWWTSWSKEIGSGVACSVLTGDVSDTVAALMTGEVDLLICYQSEHLPMTLPAERYERVVIGQETFAPYATESLAASLKSKFPSHQTSRLPLLMYTKSATFAQVHNAVVENAPDKLVGRIDFETESASVLRSMAMAGHGVAWLPECVAKEAPPGTLHRINATGWSIDLTIAAYRDKQVAFPALTRLWGLISSMRLEETAANGVN
jgi:LysR family transcriptional regulator, hypochlorite-specific transcription factor HypT